MFVVEHRVRVLLLAMPLLLGSCSTTPVSEPLPLPQRLKAACDAQVCPVDPPDYIDCMPVVSPEWEPICTTSCRDFLAQSCKIAFVD